MCSCMHTALKCMYIHSIMKEYIAKNFICYTATVQQVTFQTDLDLRQAGLGLSVQFRIKLHC